MGNGKDGTILTCGFGLIGLCCSDCLLGPCRLNPFEKDFQRGICGDDADRMVVNRLIRTVTQETLEGLGGLKEAAEALSSRRPNLKRGGRLTPEDRNRFLEKYGLPSGRSKKPLGRFLFEEIRSLLSPIAREESRLLKALFPEKAFSPSSLNPFPSASLIGTLLDAVKKDATEIPSIEKRLEQCLAISVIPLLAEELKEDIHSLLHEGGTFRKNQEIYERIRSLPPDPSPVLVLFADEEISSGGWVGESVQTLEGFFGGEALTFRLNGIGALRETGKRLSERWLLPVKKLRIVTLVSSPLVSWTLGALALGFSVISHPLLPLHGSERVETFFTDTLREWFGNRYFLSWREDAFQGVHEFLK